MREAVGNLWTDDALVVVITTNAIVTKAGCCVMGRGCAQQARDMFPGLDAYLGSLILRYESRAFNLGTWTDENDNPFWLASMPVKQHYLQRAQPALIVRSARQLVELADKFGWTSVALPRPGCGNGGLSWAQVQPLIGPILDDRFTVIDYAAESEEPDGIVRTVQEPRGARGGRAPQARTARTWEQRQLRPERER